MFRLEDSTEVTFHHSKLLVDTIQGSLGVKLPRRYQKLETYLPVTLCIVESKDKVRVGVAVCSPSDVYDRNRGRKEALADAIRVLPKEDRVRFWLAYFEARGGKKA